MCWSLMMYMILKKKNSDKYELTRTLNLSERHIGRVPKFIFYNIQNYLTFIPPAQQPEI